MTLWEASQRWIGQWREGFEALLTSNMPLCICCGGKQEHSCPLPICGHCWKSIPWIYEVACKHCGRYEMCGDCLRREETYFVQHRAAVQYDDQMKEWLAVYKYRGKEKLRQVLGPMLLHAYQLHRLTFAEPHQVQQLNEFITYVPVSEERFAERGFNQAEQLASELGKLTKLPVLPLLHRVRHTDKQSIKARNDRLDDLKDVFAADKRGMHYLAEVSRRKRLRIYMIDDVYTTGSTLNECAKTLRTFLPADVYGISWAR